VALDMPIMFSAMSYGAISLNACTRWPAPRRLMGMFANTGEGGLHRSLYKYGGNTIVQVASGRFGVMPSTSNVARIVEIKIGQGAKPGIGGHLPARR
jgi:glutamate synthase domain-containing protein 2